MRTFHIGGVAGSDITQGLPRVEEIFEARAPKGESVIAEADGVVIEKQDDNGKIVTLIIESGEGKKKKQKKYNVAANSTIHVDKGDFVTKGMQLNDGHIDLKKMYATLGKEEVHRYIVREIQEIYASQGEGINDKHIEVIIRQMFSRISVKDSGDTTLIPGEIVEMSEFNDANAEVVANKGVEAEGEPMILGITKVALSTESFLSAASFQETARVLINAAISGKKDHLRGLKENVIIGRLIPAGTGFRKSTEEK
jgi:DNA-directed RNA polymerase subunit beta'